MDRNRCHLQSPVGWLELECDDHALVRLSFLDAEPSVALAAEHPILLCACRELNDYFAGALQCFTVPVHPEGTAFRKAVWEHMKAIPYGGVTTYGELAEAIGQPKASRAVGGACHNNPIVIILPCHRVIGKHGFTDGFGGGAWRKRILLTLERDVAMRMSQSTESQVQNHTL